MASLGGQISPPGARHKSGGWRVLATSLEDARAAVERRCGPEVWAALLAELAAELREVAPAGSCGDLPDGAELEQAARTGRWDRARYPGRSEARMAILGAAVARGWRLAEVQAAIADGAWRGLGALYERAAEPRRLARLLPLEGLATPSNAANND
jgi:hypothetical protein